MAWKILLGALGVVVVATIVLSGRDIGRYIKMSRM